jgi:hypothetical protein
MILMMMIIRITRMKIIKKINHTDSERDDGCGDDDEDNGDVIIIHCHYLY